MSEQLVTPPADLLPGLARFPFPFDADTYMYSTNIEEAGRPRTDGVSHWGEQIWVVDEHYATEVAERARILLSLIHI